MDVATQFSKVEFSGLEFHSGYELTCKPLAHYNIETQAHIATSIYTLKMIPGVVKCNK